MKKIIIVLAACMLCQVQSFAQSQQAAAKEKPSVTFTKQTFTLKQGEKFVLEPVFSIPESWTATQWSLFCYFPDAPKKFPAESGLKVENPKSQWGLVRIAGHQKYPVSITNGGKASLKISTEKWPQGNYKLTFSGYFQNKTLQGNSRYLTVTKRVFVIIED